GYVLVRVVSIALTNIREECGSSSEYGAPGPDPMQKLRRTADIIVLLDKQRHFVSRAGESRVQQLSSDELRFFRKHNKDVVEAAALRLVHRYRIGKLEHISGTQLVDADGIVVAEKEYAAPGDDGAH